MRGYIENLNNNIRYKILKSDREVYLIDLQQYLISYFFPMINWSNINGYKLSEKEYNDLINPNQSKKANKKYSPIVAGLTILIAVLLSPLIQIAGIPIHFISAISIVIITFSIITLLHYFLRNKNKIRMLNTKENSHKILVTPTFKHICAIVTLYIILTLTLYIGINMLFIQTEINYIVYMFWVLLMVFQSFLNTMTFNLGKVKYKIYKQHG
ncbi:DUF443 family protein [Staphylococcus caprae]|uniref:DUF443 family protein n=1 Tax=Staphylococcus TaxID=1279 RepID=UPI0008A94C0C|nr:DUF443 family protein [Staphylococcus sp. HMSC62A08]OHS41739.1 hypothetical protein HMPREF3264_00235 [Staphylococcus sp. HMSC62A08]